MDNRAPCESKEKKKINSKGKKGNDFTEWSEEGRREKKVGKGRRKRGEGRRKRGREKGRGEKRDD